jgi:hypothetical protein
MDERKSDLIAKVPQVTLLFWIIKILATTLGETGGDAVTMSWLGETTSETIGTGYLIGTAIFGVIFVVAVLVQIRAKKISPVPLLANDCRNDDGRDHARRLLYQIARHRIYRRLNHLAHPRDCVASDLALVDREHIDRHGEYAEGRDILLGDDHVLADTRNGTRRLGRRYQ